MIKIGVVGAGFLGRIHIEAIRNISAFKLTGIYDRNPEKAAEVANLFGVQNFSSLAGLLESSEALDIVTSTSSHYSCAETALRKSKHLFIEKPLASTVDECRYIGDLAFESGVTVQVGHVERFNPAFTAVQDCFDTPMFIEAHRLAEFTARGTDVSVIHDLMIHDIDIVLSVVKSNIKRISASGVAVISDSPDIANARIEFYNGCVANLTASRISMKTMRKARFFQKDAYISIDFHKKESSIIRLNAITGNPDPFAIIIDPGNMKPKKQLTVENPEIKPVNAIRSELESFSRSIISGEQPVVTVNDGLKAVETAQMIVEKMKFTENLYQ
ncbi:MAG: Gfo/Idh/MocA family oxidoreductase [Bacteroidetes bacterium]|nr:Gfo/Idh/MocA family oxidoreductase [Bacteroidota bacterium]